MNKTMTDAIGGIIFIIIGLWFAIYHKNLGNKTSQFYYRLFHIKFSEKGYEILFLVCGVSFFIFGLLSVFYIIRFK